MPTLQHHLAKMVDNMIATTADRVAMTAAAAVGTAPVWASRVQDVSSGFVVWGPILAGLLVASKIVLTWVQIFKAARGGPPPPS